MALSTAGRSRPSSCVSYRGTRDTRPAAGWLDDRDAMAGARPGPGESALEQRGKDLGLADLGVLRGGEQCQRSVLGQVAQVPESLRTLGLL